MTQSSTGPDARMPSPDGTLRGRIRERNVAARARRMGRLPREKRAQRLETCKGCDKLKLPRTLQLCGECGCAVRLKSWLPQFTCPLGKW